MAEEYEPPKKRKPPTPPIVRRCKDCHYLVLSSAKTMKARQHTIYFSELGRLDTCPGSSKKTLDPKKSKPRHVRL